MLFESKLQTVSKIVLFVALALLLFTSSSPAQNGTFTKLVDMPTARTELASCELDGKIYVIGGSPYKGHWQNTYAVTTVEVYDPVTNSWDTTRADLQVARQGLAACTVNGKIYAIGGAISHGGTSLRTVEEYDPATNTWTKKAELPFARSYASCGVIDNKIYVAGGAVGFTSSNKLQIYDLETDEWDTSKKPMLKARAAAMGAVIQNKLYAIGGRLGSSDGWIAHNTVQMYDPVADEWGYAPPLQVGRKSHVSVVIKDDIYVVGGHTLSSYIKTIEKYDPEAQKWTNIDSIPFMMVDQSATELGDKIYFFGGTTSNYNLGNPIIAPTSAAYSYQPPLEYEEGWTKLADMPTARSELASCELDGKIYVLGGSPYKGHWENTYAIPTVEVYDPVSNSWDTTRADMQVARQALGACAVNGKIYAIGGATKHTGTPLRTVEEYDPATNTWTKKEPLPYARSYSGFGVIENKIYVAGGMATTGDSKTSTLFIYDPATDTWASKEQMLMELRCTSGAVINGKFYVFGGLIGRPDWVALTQAQMYDPATDRWEPAPNMVYGRFCPATAVIEDSIYVFGGHTTWGRNLLIPVEAYNTQRNDWSRIDITPYPVADNTATVLDSVIYLFGGTTTTLNYITPSSTAYAYVPPRIPTAVKSRQDITPDNFMLSQNYPNPFNPSTTIDYSIPKQSLVTIKIFDVQGRTVATLVNKDQPQGHHQAKFNATGLASGVYFYTLSVDQNGVETKRMLYMK